MHIYIYIYNIIYRAREKARAGERERKGASGNKKQIQRGRATAIVFNCVSFSSGHCIKPLPCCDKAPSVEGRASV